MAGVVLLYAKQIKTFRYLMAAAVIPVFATVLTRWNYNFVGLIAATSYSPYNPTVNLYTYSPTWVEFAVATLVVSYWLIAFSLATRFLPFHGERHVEH